MERVTRVSRVGEGGVERGGVSQGSRVEGVQGSVVWAESEEGEHHGGGLTPRLLLAVSPDVGLK